MASLFVIGAYISVFAFVAAHSILYYSFLRPVAGCFFCVQEVSRGSRVCASSGKAVLSKWGKRKKGNVSVCEVRFKILYKNVDFSTGF